MKISVRTVVTVLFSCGVIQFASTLLTETVKNDIVNLQNTLRRTFANGLNGGPIVANMAKLSWSTHLENIAQETLEIKCSSDSSPDLDWFRHIPWNLNVNINSNGNFTGDIISWYEEITTDFYPEMFSCWPYNRCLQAYKLLDATHKYTGCSYKRHCHNDVNVFLCLYDKENMFSSNFFSPGSLCTKCGSDQPFCEEGLCVACDPEVSACDCQKTCQRPAVGNGTLNINTCMCTCASGLGPNCDEPCRNPEQYYDYDICETITAVECNDPYQVEMLAQYCPEQCVCHKYPTV